MRDKFIEILFKNACSNENLYLLTGDLGFGVFDEFREQLPNQFLNIGVAEQNMALVAAGMAMTEKNIFIYSIANFSTLRCLEMIRNDISYHNLDVKIVSIGGGLSYGQLGMSHHATEDISIMKSIPNLSIYVPSSLSEVGLVTNHLCTTKGPAYLRLDKDLGYKDKPQFEFLSLGKPRNLFSKDAEITLLGTGGIMSQVQVATQILIEKGLRATCFAFHSIKPLKLNSIREKLHNSSLIVTVEENNLVGGFGSFIMEKMIDIGLTFAPNRFLRLGIPDQFSEIVGTQDFLRQQFSLDSVSIANSVLTHLNK